MDGGGGEGVLNAVNGEAARTDCISHFYAICTRYIYANLSLCDIRYTSSSSCFFFLYCCFVIAIYRSPRIR